MPPEVDIEDQKEENGVQEGPVRTKFSQAEFEPNISVIIQLLLYLYLPTNCPCQQSWGLHMPATCGIFPAARAATLPNLPNIIIAIKNGTYLAT